MKCICKIDFNFKEIVFNKDIIYHYEKELTSKEVIEIYNIPSVVYHVYYDKDSCIHLEEKHFKRIFDILREHNINEILK